MFINIIILIIAVGAVILVAWLAIEYLLDQLGGLIGYSPELAVLIGLIASVLLVAAIAVLMRWGDRRTIKDE
jgi:hypothetical protein